MKYVILIYTGDVRTWDDIITAHNDYIYLGETYDIQTVTKLNGLPYRCGKWELLFENNGNYLLPYSHCITKRIFVA